MGTSTSSRVQIRRIWQVYGFPICIALLSLFVLGPLLRQAAGRFAGLVPPQLRVGVLMVLGRCNCSFSNALEGARKSELKAKFEAEIARRSRLIHTDAEGYELWETRLGRFWLVAGSHKALWFHISYEQELAI